VTRPRRRFARAGAGVVEYEKRYLRPDGEIVWVGLSASVITPETGPPYLFGQYRDITAHKRDRTNSPTRRCTIRSLASSTAPCCSTA